MARKDVESPGYIVGSFEILYRYSNITFAPANLRDAEAAIYAN